MAVVLVIGLHAAVAAWLASQFEPTPPAVAVPEPVQVRLVDLPVPVPVPLALPAPPAAGIPPPVPAPTKAPETVTAPPRPKRNAPSPAPAPRPSARAPAPPEAVAAKSELSEVPAPAPAPAPPLPSRAAPAPPSAGPQAVDIGLACPRQVKPVMPWRALKEGLSGEVTARLTLKAGRVTQVEIVSAEPRGVFESAVREAALQYGCHTPGDVEVVTTQRFDFRIEP